MQILLDNYAKLGIQGYTIPEIFDSHLLAVAFWRPYRYNFRPEAAIDIVSDSAVHDIGLCVGVSFSCSMEKKSWY